MGTLPALAAVLLASWREPVDWVNPNVGGMSQLLVPTYPTVSRPSGMLRAYPQRESFASPTLSGLPLAVVFHRGGSPLTISPFASGETKPVGRYAYDLETARPYRYDVRLEDQGIDVPFAPTRRAAVYRFDFEKDGPRRLSMKARDGMLRTEHGAVVGYQNLGNGARVCLAKGCSKDAKYVQSARLNGKPLDRPWFTHEDLVAGVRLELVMGIRPNEAWGAAPGAEPPSMGTLALKPFRHFLKPHTIGRRAFAHRSRTAP